MMGDIGRLLMIVGGGLFVLGLAISLAGRFPGLGHLPGDITVRGENFTFYMPLATMVIVSVVLTVLLNVIARLFK
jgi:hypothetical protein